MCLLIDTIAFTSELCEKYRYAFKLKNNCYELLLVSCYWNKMLSE